VIFVLRTQERKGMPWFPHPNVQQQNFRWICSKQKNSSLLWSDACQYRNCKSVSCCAITPPAHGISKQNLLFAIYYVPHRSNVADSYYDLSKLHLKLMKSSQARIYTFIASLCWITSPTHSTC
jgi:hypothetical protein